MRERKRNGNAAALKVGMKVTSDFVHGEEDIVRTLLTIEPQRFGCGFKASADGGEQPTTCSTCGHTPKQGTPIHPIDGTWFVPAEGG